MSCKLYWNGSILTMRSPKIEQALLVENGRIKKVGSLEEVTQNMNPETQRINLEGKTLMPAFIDSHSHITALATTIRLLPLSDVKSFQELIEKLKEVKRQQNLKSGQWIIGFGYDHNQFIEKSHPTNQVLDQASMENPIIISHVSGHMGVMNSLGLKETNITANTPNPVGGMIGRHEDGYTPNGYLEETAFSSASSAIPKPSLEQLVQQLELAQNIYFQNGITTIQDGITKKPDWNILHLAAEKKKLIADVVSYVDERNFSNLYKENPQYHKKYQNHLKLGGYKIFLDGSPQGRTAWITKPYLNGEQGYCGYPIYEDREVEQLMKKALYENVQLLVHCNGDAACEQMIRCYQKAKQNVPKNEIRPVMIHAQLVQKEQLKRMKELSIIASFFIAHTYYWADVHIKNFGKERAYAISPAKSAFESGLKVTFHQDSPVILPNMLETIWCAVNRITKEGVILEQNEKITTYQALEAVTSNAAYQYFEQDRKGILECGKVADMIILDKNPLETAVENIKDIQILETIKEGETVFCR